MNRRQTHPHNTQNNTSSQHSQSRRSHTQYTHQHTQYRDTHSNHKNTNNKQIIKTAMFIIPILMLLSAFVYNFFFKEVKETVIDKLWQTSVSTETYKEVMEEDWHIPQGGTEIFRRKEIHHYEQKQDGYKTETYTEREFSHNETYTVTKDLGNGKFKQETKTRPAYKTVTKTRSVPKYVEVPVYRTKYTYSIWRWEPNTKLIKKGNYTSIIEFEDFKEIEGKQRIVNKSIDYSIECKAHYDKLMCVINKFNKERKCIAKNTTAEFATEIEIYYHFAILVSLALGKDIENESITTATDLLNILVKVREGYEWSDYNYSNLKEFFSYTEKVLAKEYNENLNRNVDRFWKKKELEYKIYQLKEELGTYEEPDTNPGTQKREQPNKSQIHSDICKELNDIYTAKNHDYGDSFADTFKTLGPVSAVTRITDKCNRLQSLVTKPKDNQKVNESIEDTLMDLANYAIMTLMELKLNK